MVKTFGQFVGGNDLIIGTIVYIILIIVQFVVINKGSERVMQKNGLIKEADHKDYEWHDGKMKDRLEYRLLKTEWENNRS